MARLSALLINSEMYTLEKMHPGLQNKQFRDLTVSELSDIAISVLYKTEFGAICPAGIFSAKAIEILTARAIKNKIDLLGY